MTGDGLLVERLAAAAAANPEAPAISTVHGRVVRYGELERQIRAASAGFLGAGLAPGDRVLFAVRPGALATALVVGIIDAGGVVVPADLTMGDELFAARMAALDPRWVVAESLLLAATAGGLVTRLLRWRGLRFAPIGSLRRGRFVRAGRWLPGVPRALSAAKLLRDGRRSLEKPSVLGPEEPTFIVFTSGTTGSPKAAVHCRRSLDATLNAISARLALGPGDVMFARELHFVLPALAVGALALVPPPGERTAAQTLRVLERWRVTHLFLTPHDGVELVELCEAERRKLPATLRQVVLGSAPCRAPLLSRLGELLPEGARATCVYGMTEMLPVATVALEEKLAWRGDGDLVGAPVGEVQARLGDDGELFVRGPGLFRGYLGEPAVGEHATGDLARFDDGRIVLLGRKKDMILRRAFNIYPELYEPSVERIAGVRRCAMVGLYDDERGDETVALAIEPNPGVEAGELASRVRAALSSGAQRIDPQALPDSIHVLPLPVAGRSAKIDKQALRDLLRNRSRCASP